MPFFHDYDRSGAENVSILNTKYPNRCQVQRAIFLIIYRTAWSDRLDEQRTAHGMFPKKRRPEYRRSVTVAGDKVVLTRFQMR